MGNIIQQATTSPSEALKNQSVNALMNGLLDREGMRKRFNDLLGKRAPQFISSIISLVNASPDLTKAMIESPMTVIQAGLRAAVYDLPIDPGLGYAYIVPFKNNKNGGKMEAKFIPGYKGMEQLALRSGAYSRVPDAVDVREGELIRYDRLTGDAEFKWVEDEDLREDLPIIGYAGYFRLKNGAEKTIYMTKAQIERHEKKNRKGQYMGKGWRDDWDAMAKKTVLRRLIGHYGIMSIDYQDHADPRAVEAAANLMQSVNEPDFPDGVIDVDRETGEVIDTSAMEAIENS